jgi:AraC-like DNA-binding protein
MDMAPSERSEQRVGPLADLPALVTELGADPSFLFEGTGLTASDLRADHFIPFSLFTQLLDIAASTTGRPDISLLLGLRQAPESIGPIGRLMSYAPTLGDALTDFVSFQIANSRGAASYLHRMGDDFALGIGVYDRHFRSSTHGYDLAIAVGCSIIRRLTNGKVAPVEILMIRRDPTDPSFYRQLGQCPVRFNQLHCCIVLSAPSMKFRLRTANPVAHAKLLDELSRLLSRPSWGVAAQVRHALRPMVLAGTDSLSDIAMAIDLHPRTLERRLEHEGTTFDAIKDEVRFTMAKDLLLLTSLPIGEISASLAYGSHSSFVHAFHRWSGTTPSRWRKDNTRALEGAR